MNARQRKRPGTREALENPDDAPVGHHRIGRLEVAQERCDGRDPVQYPPAVDEPALARHLRSEEQSRGLELPRQFSVVGMQTVDAPIIRAEQQPTFVVRG